MSCTPMVKQMADSLMMVTNSLAMAGRMLRMACGRIMKRMVCSLDMPSEREASVWPPSIDWMPERMISDRYAPELSASATTPGKNRSKRMKPKSMKPGRTFTPLNRP